ncbi:MAG: V-type ATP synthase subunit D [Methanoregula sp.]|jgi:V/A-type H+-transporting ATPase subunit D|nr:V-type ATP synthase subunit D [Methanoregula sp.]
MKIKLTQGELKRQRDALRQYERYLPTLQLKKQQLQLEILHQQSAVRERKNSFSGIEKSAENWSGLLVEAPEIRQWLIPAKIITAKKNIAGVDIPVFEHVDFEPAEYDLFLTPLWVDSVLETLRNMVTLQEEIRVIEEGISVLKHELRITTQRVNLFEKIKIPGAKEAIRLIKIYIGDQMTNAVGRSKIAKKKIEETNSGEVAA